MNSIFLKVTMRSLWNLPQCRLSKNDVEIHFSFSFFFLWDTVPSFLKILGKCATSKQPLTPHIPSIFLFILSSRIHPLSTHWSSSMHILAWQWIRRSSVMRRQYLDLTFSDSDSFPKQKVQSFACLRHPNC